MKYTSFGYLGVDFFFALSGFIIFLIHHKDIGQPASIAIYAKKRFIRIYPLYWLVTGAVLLGAVLTHGRNAPPTSIMDIASTLSLIHFNDFLPPVGTAWTLYHEIFFYALFSVFLLDRRAGMVSAAAWLIVIFAASRGDSLLSLGMSAALIAAPVNLSFFGGAGAFFLHLRLNRRQGALATCVGSAMVATLLYAADPSTIIFKVLLAAGFMLVVGGVSGIERSGFDFRLPVLTNIGNASFTLYLTHENIQSAGLKIIHSSPLLRALPVEIDYFVLLGLSVGAALVLYPLVEKPLLSLLRRHLLSRHSPHARHTPQARLD